MSTEERPRLSVKVSSIKTLADVTKWAAMVEALDLPASSVISASAVDASLTAECWLQSVRTPDGE